jgi:uncharacterized YigZ family protein
MQGKFSYKTLNRPSVESLYKEKGSKFFGYAFPVESQNDIDDCLTEIKKRHAKARHWCYAWQLGVDEVKYRFQDDGEPTNSAGKPIYGQIQSFDLTDILIVVVRYFGGVKLGVGGLIHAYREAAKETIEISNIVEKQMQVTFDLKFEYPHLNKVMRIIKEMKLEIVSQKMELDCCFQVSVPKISSNQAKKRIEDLRVVELKEIT